jgi:EmrB/QacA subfamily drug resistance transporter
MIAVGMGIFLATIDSSIVNVALPTLVRALDTDFAIVQWVVLAYLLTLTTLMLSMGRLADMIGKKLLYMTGFVVFTIGSVLCGISPSVYWLIGFRVVQAVGGAMALALGAAIITEAFPGSERGKALGVSGLIVSLGIVVGPTLGGLLLDSLSWHWIFLVNLPVGILGTLAVWRFVPDFKPGGGQRFDYSGAITLCITLVALLLALTFGQQIGFGQPLILALFVGAAVFFAIFLMIETRTAQPMIELSLFKNRLFSLNLFTGLLTFVAIAGTMILIPFYLEEMLGYGPSQVGLLLAVLPITLGISAPISGMLSDRMGTRPISLAGLAVMLIGYYTATGLDADTSIIEYILRFLPIGIGMGIFQSPNNSAIMGAAPRQRLGIASSLLSMTRTMGQIIGIAILGALWSSRVFAYEGHLVPEGATAASISSQVAGLQDVFWLPVVLIFIAFLSSLWGLIQERRMPAATPATTDPASRPPVAIHE